MVRIPSEYQEVEYIESTGTQYIDTGLQFGGSDFKITSRFAQTQRTAGEQPLISIWSSTYQYWNCFIRDTNRAVDFYLGGHVVPQSPVLSVNEIIDIALERNGSEWTITQPGSTLSKTYNPSRVNDTSMKIFKRGDINGTAYVRMYSLTVEMDGELAANFIPYYHKSSGEIGMYDTVSKQFYTNSGTGTFLKGNDVTYDNINLLESRRRILLNTPHIETISDTIASFETDVATKIKGCKVYFTPIQEGEGDPSPENVRPIHGWDGVTVTACGKNLFDATLRDGRYVNGIWNSTNTWRTTNLIPVKSNQKYCVSFNHPRVISSMQWNLFDKDGNWIHYTYSNIVTTTDDTAFLTFCSTRTTLLDEWKDIQLELGSESTDYEPYTATTLTIPFPQTIYGGYVDLVKGEVVETWHKWVEDGSRNIAIWPWKSSEENDYAVALLTGFPDPYKRSTTDQRNTSISETRVWTDINRGPWNPHNVFGVYTANNYSYAISYPYNKVGHTKTDLQAYLAENPEVFVYKLYTPITYPIDPQTLKALRGMNNIWSDANGNIEVSFYTH